MKRSKRRRLSSIVEVDGSEEDSSSSSAGSSANEYAEGLGCADRKRCREKACTGYSFDDHPREEYFEEPVSDKHAITSDDDADVFEHNGPNLSSCKGVLQQMAVLEAAEEAYMKEEARKGIECQSRLAMLRRKCELRAQRRLEVASGIVPPKPSVQSPKARSKDAVPVMVKAECGDESAATLETRHVRQLCHTLRHLRSRCDGSTSLTPQQVKQVLHTIRALAACRVTVAVLKATGAGRELNLKSWRLHPVPAIASASSDLVKRWREKVESAKSKVDPAALGA